MSLPSLDGAVRFSAVAACATLLAGIPAHAVWDMSSSAALNQIWSENGTYTATGANGEAISNLRLTGTLQRLARRSQFDATYTPSALFYRDRTDLNRLSHLASLRETLNLSPRSTLSLSDAYYYSPEQGASSAAFNSPIVLTRLSDRRSNAANVTYRIQPSRVSSYVFDARHQIQSFSSSGLADSSGLTFGARYMRDFSGRSGLDAGASYGRTRFERPAGTTDVDILNVFVGGRLGLGRVMTASARVGQNSVEPADPNRPSTTGLQAESNLQWSFRKAQAQIGYHQGISTGSGTFDASESKSYYGSVRAELMRKLSADLYGNRSVSRNATTGGSRSVRTLSGGARLTYTITNALDAQLGFTRNVQQSSFANAPDLRFNSYSLGLLARFD